MQISRILTFPQRNTPSDYTGVNKSSYTFYSRPNVAFSTHNPQSFPLPKISEIFCRPSEEVCWQGMQVQFEQRYQPCDPSTPDRLAPDSLEESKSLNPDFKNQDNSDDKNEDCQIMQIIIPALKRQKAKRRKKRATSSSSRKNILSRQKTTSPQWMKEIKIPEGEFFNFIKDFELRITSDDDGRDSLHFNNPSQDLCTRCDVVYKTILRDCRKYYSDLFEEVSGRRSRELSHIFELIESYSSRKFQEASPETCQEIKFYLRCFVKQRMNASRRGCQIPAVEYDRDRPQTAKANRLHEILYKFSLEKLEEFFSSEALTRLFYQYMKHYQVRLENSKVMRKSHNVYYSAMKLILIRTQRMMFSEK